MKSSFKRILCLTLVLLLVLSVGVPAFAAEQAESEVRCAEGNLTYFMPNNGSGPVGFGGIVLAEANNNFTIKRSSVKLTKGAQLMRFVKITDTKIAQENHGETWETVNDKLYYRYQCAIKVPGPGTYKLSYKYNGTKHTLNITVKPYENPVQSLVITGIKKEANLASATKKTVRGENNPATYTLPEKTKNAKLTITTKGSWRVGEISIRDLNYGGLSRTFTFRVGLNNAPTTFTVPLGNLNVKHNYGVEIKIGYLGKDQGMTVNEWSSRYLLHGAKAPKV